MSSNVQCIDEFFPDGILGTIFRYVPPESYNSLRRVSKRWKSVADRYLGRVLVVKSGNVFMVDPESNIDRMSVRSNYWMTLSTQTNNNCTGLFTYNKTENEKNKAAEQQKECEDADVEEVEKVQDIPNPEFVRKIGFLGHLSLTTYTPLECILKPCKNITSLYLHMSLFNVSRWDDSNLNVTSRELEPWSVSSCLPRLKELTIDSSGISYEDSAQIFGFKHAFLSVSAFLCAQRFTDLAKLIIALPYMESTEGILVRAMCIFLGRHATSVKQFSYTQKYEIPNDEERASESEDDNQESPSVGAHHQGDGDQYSRVKNSYDLFTTDTNYLALNQLALSAKELKHVSLEELHVVLLSRKQESSPIWKNLLIRQSVMRKCIFTGDKIPLPQGAILANSQTLVNLRLTVRDAVDLKCFRNCVHLKYLSLGARSETNQSFDDYETISMNKSQILYENAVQLKNAEYLPTGLESLEILNLRTHKNDARTIALETPSLRDLQLKNLGWEGDLGLTVTDLTATFGRRKLEHLCIKASVNMLSYAELEEESSSAEINLFACVLQSNSFAAASGFYLEVWKRQDGFYSTRKPARDSEPEEEELDVFQIPNKVELREEEPDSCSSSCSSESEGEDEYEDDKSDDEEMSTEKQADSDEDEWQECGDGESDEHSVYEHIPFLSENL